MHAYRIYHIIKCEAHTAVVYIFLGSVFSLLNVMSFMRMLTLMEVCKEVSKIMSNKYESCPAILSQNIYNIIFGWYAFTSKEKQSHNECAYTVHKQIILGNVVHKIRQHFTIQTNEHSVRPIPTLQQQQHCKNNVERVCACFSVTV